MARNCFANGNHKHIAFFEKLKFVNFSRVKDAIMELFREKNDKTHIRTTSQEERLIQMWFQFGTEAFRILVKE